jgi:hypothetical protein
VLLNPRKQRWKRHFRWNGAWLLGLTPCARATIDVLNINSLERIDLRELLVAAGLFLPTEIILHARTLVLLARGG